MRSVRSETLPGDMSIDLAGVLGAVFEHETAVNLHADALKIPPFSH